MKVVMSVLLSALTMLPASVLAQTCASPIPLPGNATVTGDTCSASNELGTLCIFAQSPGNDIVYTFTLTPPYTSTAVALTNHTPAWNAAMVLLGAPCNGNTVCARNADANGAGGNEVIDITGLAGGTYFLIVTSSPADPSCGSYSLVANGTPVMLQSFDVT